MKHMLKSRSRERKEKEDSFVRKCPKTAGHGSVMGQKGSWYIRTGGRGYFKSEEKIHHKQGFLNTIAIVKLRAKT